MNGALPDTQQEGEGAHLQDIQQELRESESRLRAIVESSLDAIITIDEGNRITEFNPAAEAVFGWRRQEVLGRDLGETLIPPAMRAAHWQGLQRHRESLNAPRVGVRLELTALRRDGSEFPVELTVTRIAVAGRPQFTAFMRDLTATRAAQAEAGRLAAELRDSEQQYRSLFVNNPQPMAVYDPRTLRFLAVNTAAMAQYGYSEAEFLALTIEDLRPEEDRQAWQQEVFGRPLRGPRQYRGRHRHKDGQLIHVQVYAADILFQGRPARMVLAVDTGEQRRAALQLRESQRMLALLLANFPGMAYRCRNDSDWTLEFVSQGALELTGYPPEDFISGAVRYAELIDPQDRDAVWQQVQAALEKGRQFQLTYRLRTASGTLKWVWEQGAAVDEAGRPAARLEGFILDVTQARLAQQEVARLNAELEERVRQRTEQLQTANAELEAFSYSIAHDLRSPLTSIDGFSHVLEAGHAMHLDAQGRHCVQRIRAGVRQMSELTDALLSLAHLSRVNLRAEAVDLAQAARATLSQLGEREPGRVVDARIAPQLWARGDPRLLTQVMVNLVGNAWKFSGRKPLTRIEVDSLQSPSGETVFFVADQGAGFDMAYAGRLFGAFQRLHGPSEFEGTGIGLALVQKIVQRHGGRIWAEARPGEGASFYFTLGAGSAP